jgi:hypothetical protein
MTSVSARGLTGTSRVGAASMPTAARAQLGAGLSIVVPTHWHIALKLTDLIEPYERFTLASFPLRRPPRRDLGCGPTQAVAAIPADGALASVFEFPEGGSTAGRSFAAQPKRFTLPAGPSEPYDCFGRGWLVRFRAGDRRFQVMIAVGRRAGANRERLLRALSSLHVDATRASG